MKAPARPASAPEALPLGTRVRVTRGLSAGREGVIVEWSRHVFSGEPMALVDLGGVLGARVLRATYFEVLP